MLRRFAEYETSIDRAKRVLMIINGSLMIINVQKTTSAKRDVNGWKDQRLNKKAGTFLRRFPLFLALYFFVIIFAA